jgi:predicted small lipoprotein YifL
MAYSVPALATFNLPMKRSLQTGEKPLLALLIGSLWLCSLAACGQTGPLYLPDETEQSKPSEPPPVSEETAEDEIEQDEDSR